MIKHLIWLVILPWSQCIIWEPIPINLEAEPLFFFRKVHFSYSVKGVNIDILVILRSTERLILECISAKELKLWYERICLLTDYFVACIIGFIVGYKWFIFICDVVAWQKRIGVPTIHWLRAQDCLLKSWVGVICHYNSLDGRVSSQHRVHLFQLL